MLAPLKRTSSKSFNFDMQSFVEPSCTQEKRLDYLLIAAAIEEQLQFHAEQKPDTTHNDARSQLMIHAVLATICPLCADVFVRRFSSMRRESAAKFSFGYESRS